MEESMEQGGAGRENRHSRMGIASFIIAILTTVLIVVLFIIAGVIGASVFSGADPGSIDPQSIQDSPAFAGLALVGIGFIVGIGLFLVGLVLGLIGIFQRRRKRLFAVLGTIFNGLAVLAVVAVVVIGLVVGTSLSIAWA